MKASVFVFVLFLGSCAAPAQLAAPPEPLPTVPSTTTVPRAITVPPAPALSAVTAPSVASPSPTVATVRGELAVYPDPWSVEPSEYLPATTVLGTPTVVRIIDSSDSEWANVSLPGRPNGRTGWIRLGDVDLSIVTTLITVDLTARHLEVWNDGTLVISTPVAVGSATSPTPTGIFFVTDAIDMTANSGAWGPFAFGLSARSDVITEFNGGDGIIGIHGTNRPSSIGEARSLGCVRVPNDVILEMSKLIELGAAVEIRS